MADRRTGRGRDAVHAVRSSVLACALLAGCVATAPAATTPTTVAGLDASSTPPASGPTVPEALPTPLPVPTATPTPTPLTEQVSPSPTPAPRPTATAPPSWFRQRLLDVTATGFPAPQEAPPEYVDRRLITIDHLPPPTDDAFAWTAGPVPDDLVERSTWREDCPTTLEALRYVTVTYWGFDGLHHTGDLIMNADAVDTLRTVFLAMHEERFPLEQVALPGPVDFHEFHRRGDDNITAMYDCRASTGSTRWSQHAYGRAIDINPFHNPYRKQTEQGLIVLPAYATAYVDRDRVLPGMIVEGDAIVRAFDAAGWGWGGRWNTLRDWQHFSASGS